MQLKKIAHLDDECRDALLAAVAEADRRGDRRVGTDHLLLGLLVPPDALARAVTGTELDAARRAMDRLDLDALTAVGVGLDALPTPAPRRVRRRPRARFSHGARAALGRAVGTCRARDDGAIRARHVLVALLDAPEPDRARDLLRALACDPDEVRAALEPGEPR